MANLSDNSTAVANNIGDNNSALESSTFGENTEESGSANAAKKSMPVDTEEKNLEINENGTKKGPTTANNTSTASTNRAKKRKKPPRDATAPKQPLTGYFRFLNDRREKVRMDNPSTSFPDITKLLASEWSNLPIDQKQQYLDAAEVDKERYIKEYSDYKQTEAYRIFVEKKAQQQNEHKKERNGTDQNPEPNQEPQERSNKDFSGFDIPIFTEEFLDHNKACETELRQLRKATTDYEAQNAVLQRHIDSLNIAVNRLEMETHQQRSTNTSLQRHFDSLRSQLVSAFSSIPVPGNNEGATHENFDNYIEGLEGLLNGNVESSLRSAIRNSVSRLDFGG